MLVVYAPGNHTIDEEEQAVLTELGQTIAQAIQRTHSQRALAADTATELQLQIAKSDHAFGAVTAECDCELTCEQYVPVGDGRGLQYVTVHGGEPAGVCARLDDVPFVDTCTVVRDPDDDTESGALVEVRIGDKSGSVLGVLVEYGAALTMARAADGNLTVTVEVPPESAVREIMTAVRDVTPTAKLVSKRQVDRSVTTVSDIKQRISNQLTAQQETALTIAYTRGYYDWPRGSTAEEIADTMDIASATLHYHLRHATHTLLTAYLDGSCL